MVVGLIEVVGVEGVVTTMVVCGVGVVPACFSTTDFSLREKISYNNTNLFWLFLLWLR